MAWLQEHSEVISALASVGTLVVWVLYLQVFLILCRRQVKPTILIEVGEGTGLDRRCLVINMSGEAIAIRSLVCGLHTDDTTITRSVTNVELEDDEPVQEPEAQTSTANPVSPGEMLDVGSFRELLNRLLRHAEEAPQSLPDDARLSVQVVAAYGSDDLPVSAHRNFHVRAGNGNGIVKPLTFETQQVGSARQRRRLKRLAVADGTFSGQ